MRSYRGSSDDVTGPKPVEVLEDGKVVGVLRHIVKHSPTGMNWGYGGSGPADLALSILVDHLGERAVCEGCAGCGQQFWSEADEEWLPWSESPLRTEAEKLSIGRCMECAGERWSFGPALYQAFKFDLIAPLPQTGRWEITADDVEHWLSHAAEPRR